MQSDLGLHCLPRPICPKSNKVYHKYESRWIILAHLIKVIKKFEHD